MTTPDLTGVTDEQLLAECDRRGFVAYREQSRKRRVDPLARYAKKLEFACSYCGVPAGVQCVTESGLPAVFPHANRYRHNAEVSRASAPEDRP